MAVKCLAPSLRNDTNFSADMVGWFVFRHIIYINVVFIPTILVCLSACHHVPESKPNNIPNTITILMIHHEFQFSGKSSSVIYISCMEKSCRLSAELKWSPTCKPAPQKQQQQQLDCTEYGLESVDCATFLVCRACFRRKICTSTCMIYILTLNCECMCVWPTNARLL